MKKRSITEYMANSLRWLGVVLVLTAALIWGANPTNVIVFLAPYSGSRAILAKSIAGLGILTTATGYALSRYKMLTVREVNRV